MAQLIVQNTQVNYVDTGGKGSVLLCLHGWMQDTASFAQLTKSLGSTVRLLAVDLPNFGASQKVDSVLSIDDYAHFIKAFIEKLGIREYYLVGHSMGGQIAIYAVGSGILSPNGLVLIASSGIRNHNSFRKKMLRLASKIIGPIIPASLKKSIYRKLGSDYSTDLSETHKKIIAHVLSHDVLRHAKQITIPTLLIYGSEDTSTPLWMGKLFHEAIKGSKLEVIHGKDHWVHQTASSQSAQCIKDFIDAKS